MLKEDQRESQRVNQCQIYNNRTGRSSSFITTCEEECIFLLLQKIDIIWKPTKNNKTKKSHELFV